MFKCLLLVTFYFFQKFGRYLFFRELNNLEADTQIYVNNCCIGNLSAFYITLNTNFDFESVMTPITKHFQIANSRSLIQKKDQYKKSLSHYMKTDPIIKIFLNKLIPKIIEFVLLAFC